MKKLSSQHSLLLLLLLLLSFGSVFFLFRGAINGLCFLCVLQDFSIVVVAVVGFVLFFYLMGKSTPLHSILVINKNAFYLVKLSEILIHIYIFIAWLSFIPDSRVYDACVCVAYFILCVHSSFSSHLSDYFILFYFQFLCLFLSSVQPSDSILVGCCYKMLKRFRPFVIYFFFRSNVFYSLIWLWFHFVFKT